jgi:hypothetical protein
MQRDVTHELNRTGKVNARTKPHGPAALLRARSYGTLDGRGVKVRAVPFRPEVADIANIQNRCPSLGSFDFVPSILPAYVHAFPGQPEKRVARFGAIPVARGSRLTTRSRIYADKQDEQCRSSKSSVPF